MHGTKAGDQVERSKLLYGRLELRSIFPVTICCAFSAIGSFLFGYDTGIIASSIAQEDFKSYFGGNRLSDDAVGGIVSSFTAGAFIGTLMVSSISDRYGRKAAIFSGALLACLGGALQGGANSLATIIIGRIFAGLGIGLLSPTIPNYCSEIAHPRIRGLLGGMQQWMLGLGIVTAQWAGYGSSKVDGPFSWRFPLSIQVAPGLLLACGVWALPESPRFLAKKGDESAAYKVLERLHLGGRSENRILVDAEMRRIRDIIEIEQNISKSYTWRDLVCQPLLRKRVMLACGIQLFTQTSGTNVIGYYGPRIYSALGYTTQGALFITALYGVLALLFNTVCIAIVDRVGRRKLLIPSMIGMGAALCVEATLAKYYPPKDATNVNALRASVAMNFVFALFFTSLGVISWIYQSEIFPTPIRARGTALATCTNWATNLVFAQCTPIALTRMGYRYFYLFTAFNWCAALLVYLYFPETNNGKTLEEVQKVFDDYDCGSLDGSYLETPKHSQS